MIFAKKVPSSESSTTLNVKEPGPYSVEIIVHDRAKNYKVARRIILFDNASIVILYGEKSRVIQAKETGWINKQSDSIEIIWPKRFRNLRHSNGGWLNGVKENEQINRDLDDREGRSSRTVDKLYNLEGIVRFDIARNVEVNGVSNYSGFERGSEHYFKLEKMIYAGEKLVDVKRITYFIRGLDAVWKFAEDNVTVTIDVSPPVIQNIWLTKAYSINFRVQGVLQRIEVSIDWETFDYHSGIHDFSWKIFDNFTEFVHGQSHVQPQKKKECKNSDSKNASGGNCYCSPYNGCFRKHFHVKAKVSKENFIRLIKGIQSEEHDFDYFIEVTVTNNAGLTTVQQKKVTLFK